MNANGRRCRQFKNGFRHLAKRGRPTYKKVYTSISESIERERAMARRAMNSQKKKK